MLEFKGLYKETISCALNHISLTVEAGQIASIECSQEVSDLLFDLILGRTVPAKGDILIAGVKHTEALKLAKPAIGVVQRESGYYERMRVKDYIALFHELNQSRVNCDELLLKLALLDQAHTQIRQLSYSQRKRLAFAREMLKNPRLLLLQEPLLNMPKEDARVILESIEELCAAGTAVVGTSVSFKETLLLGGHAYHLDSGGLSKLHNSQSGEDQATAVQTVPMQHPDYTVAKISAKLEDRIMLFDPAEIDYIEAQQAGCHLHVKGEKFVASLSLNELEDRLKPFGFFRNHRSYLVNLQRVREVVTFTRNSYSLSLDDKNKTTIPLSKGRLDDLKTILSL